MVRMQEPSEYDKLEAILRKICDERELVLRVEGWTRKTFDIYQEDRRAGTSRHLVRIESLATTNGEIAYFDDQQQELAVAIGTALEETFPIQEAILVKTKRPEY